MTASVAPKISKWPFFLGDALLIALACFISAKSQTPMGALEVCVYVACIAIGAWISITPFLKEYQAELKFAESNQLLNAASQLKNLEQLAGQIGYATAQWQTIRESADKTAASAKSIADGMAAEVKAFNEFIQKTSDSEKATLRLEIEKLRRGEVEWLQVVVRILDHVFAVHQAALRSRQPGLADQLGRFQAACVDTARRIGLVPFTAAPGESFDSQKHQLMDGPDAKAPEGAVVEFTAAAGYTFQGRMIRPAMVKLQSAETAEQQVEAAESQPGAAEPQSVETPAAGEAPAEDSASTAPKSEPQAPAAQQSELL